MTTQPQEEEHILYDIHLTVPTSDLPMSKLKTGADRLAAYFALEFLRQDLPITFTADTVLDPLDAGINYDKRIPPLLQAQVQRIITKLYWNLKPVKKDALYRTTEENLKTFWRKMTNTSLSVHWSTLERLKADRDQLGCANFDELFNNLITEGIL